jgi:hypothetical protein
MNGNQPQVKFETHLAGTLVFWLCDGPRVSVHNRLFVPIRGACREHPVGFSHSMFPRGIDQELRHARRNKVPVAVRRVA